MDRTGVRAWVDRYAAGGSALRFFDKSVNRAGRKVGTHAPSVIYGSRVVDFNAAVRRLNEMLLATQPMAVVRLGGNEQDVLMRYIRRNGQTRPSGSSIKFPRYLRRDISNAAGVNPPTDEVLTRFCDLYFDSLADVDGVGVWFHQAERRLIGSVVPSDAELFPLPALDPILTMGGWAAALEGKRVCVVHPFADSIRRQYRRRVGLMVNSKILPEFDLTIVPAVQAMGGLPSGAGSWFDALSKMSDAMVRTESEIALIGAGAFGLPLAVAAKRAGMRALHVGGGLQLLFGISGHRWDSKAYVRQQQTDLWVRPSESERPANADRVEGGCYW